MINDDDDFKECKKGGAAKKVGHASSTGSRSKRSRRQVLKDSGKVDGKVEGGVMTEILHPCRF